jgi:hypothetical protein
MRLSLGAWMNWLIAKLHLVQLNRWLKQSILRRKPEVRRPFFPRGPTCYEQLLIDRAAEAERERCGKHRSVGEIGERIRRLSFSTVRSVKKACHLSCERDDLREEDRRAMLRLEVLWNSKDD